MSMTNAIEPTRNRPINESLRENVNSFFPGFSERMNISRISLKRFLISIDCFCLLTDKSFIQRQIMFARNRGARAFAS